MLLELGGKAPLIVLDDADLDAAVDAAVFGAFANQGQICMSTERLIVDESVADAFVEKLAKRAAALPAGDPRGHVVLGSLVNLAAAERMDALIADAVAKGAKVVAGGKRNGAIVEATIVDHVKPGMRIYGEESFGPVKPVDPRQGRGRSDPRRQRHRIRPVLGGLQPRRAARARRSPSGIETGICHINGPTVHDEAQMPFGGVKASGYGRFGSKAVIAEFTDLRWITIEGPQHYPF